jgi:tRNA threonylcarbamoyladenosine biosynthesis protein TsaE
MTRIPETGPAGAQVTARSFAEGTTEEIAGVFALGLRGGEIVSLEGDLGAGKTFFARAVARALGVTEHVTSPTFVLQKTYALSNGPARSLVHYDLYRMESYAELMDIGFEDAIDNAVTLVEWGDRFLGQYPRTPLRVRLDIVSDHAREIHFGLPDAERAGQLARALGERGVAVHGVG